MKFLPTIFIMTDAFAVFPRYSSWLAHLTLIINCRGCFCALIIVFFSLQLFAVDNQAIINEANQAYSDGIFEKATGLYEEVLANGLEAPELYYNLGNAYFKMNRIPAAILNYERAIRIAPNDADIRYNLKLANLKTVDKTEGIPPLFFKVWWNEITNVCSADKWGVISLTSFWLFFVFFSSCFIFGIAGWKKLFFWISSFLFILSIFSFTFGYQRNKVMQSNNEAILFSVSVIVKSSPDDNGTDLFILHEGTKVTITDSIGEWNKIKLSDGNMGWLKSEAIELI